MIEPDEERRWLKVIGIGEDGLAGLAPAARRLVEEAEVIIGGDRHPDLGHPVHVERIAWPASFDATVSTIRAQKGRRLVVLVTGDPLWYSIGARLLKAVDAGEIAFFPQLSVFQLAACRLGWSIPDVETLTVHGRPAEQIVPFIAPGVRMLVLTQDATSLAAIAELLAGRGYGASRLTALVAMGGPEEAMLVGTADAPPADAPDFHTLAVECIAGLGAVVHPRTGLPDDAFAHDGAVAPRVARAAALAKLAPHRGALLWDVGAGCGSIGIEWMRAAPEAHAIGIEPDADQRALAVQNASALGAPKLTLIDGKAPEALEGLTAPDAVFVGGGISRASVGACMVALNPLGRLVAHATTTDEESVLREAAGQFGGQLEQIACDVFDHTSKDWVSLPAVVQWHWVKTPPSGSGRH